MKSEIARADVASKRLRFNVWDVRLLTFAINTPVITIGCDQMVLQPKLYSMTVFNPYFVKEI
ncbi:MAG: hypothetical protein ACJAYR_000686 [Sneathiella sp.]|jgi:hypothetical protein